MKLDNKPNNKDNIQEYKISIEGSLGLLALGDIGLRKWREVKLKSRKDSPE